MHQPDYSVKGAVQTCHTQPPYLAVTSLAVPNMTPIVGVAGSGSLFRAGAEELDVVVPGCNDAARPRQL
jgi:hypothetical protein